MTDQAKRGKELGASPCSLGLDCPNCENVGWYMVPDENGEPTPEQCQWCYTVEDSKFNLANIEASQRLAKGPNE